MEKHKAKLKKFAIVKWMTRQKIETYFLAIFLFFGIITALLVPPGWNTDEPDHTYRIDQLSRGDLLAEFVKSPAGNPAYGGPVASGLVNLYQDAGVTNAGSRAGNKDMKATGLYEQHPAILDYKEDGTITPINFSGAALYSPLTYILYIPIFKIGALLHLPFVTIILLCRLIGLLAVAAAFFFAIKYIKAGKWIIFAVGLLPVTVAQAVTVGADGPLLAVGVLFLMYATNIVFGSTKLKVKQFSILALIGMILALIKIAYAPLVLLILLMPFIKKGELKRKNIICAAIAVLVALTPSVIWTDLVSYINTNSNLQANFPLQKSFILHHPLLYIKTIGYTYFTNEQNSLGGLFGNAVWNSVPLPAIYSYLAAATLIISLGVKDSREAIMKRIHKHSDKLWRIGLLSVVLATILAISTALYIYSSTLHQSSIIGIQARYFIPLLPFILLALWGNYYQNQFKPKMVIIVLSLVVLTGATFVLYSRLYQTLPQLLG